jgi:hypothetical protein
MITGVVTDDRQAIIHLIVRGPAGQEQEIEAIIDTGFDGSLSLPSSTVVQLGLPWRQRAAHFWQMAARASLISTKPHWIGTEKLGALPWMRPKPFRLLVCLCLKAMSLPSRSNVLGTSP